MKVVIVGAGPAGLFSAHELAAKCDVTLLERRDFVGGSGLHSDGKLNFHPKIGGDLTQFLPEDRSWRLVHRIRDIFRDLGVEMTPQDEAGLRKLEAEASKAGLKFVRIEQTHIGSDRLPTVMSRMKSRLEDMGVNFHLNTKAQDLIVEEGDVKAVETSEGVFRADAMLLAPGRIGSQWLIGLMRRLGVEMRYNPIDLGLRVEVPNPIMDRIIQGYGIWDPKFHLYTPSYDDFVRTFCVCPSGFVVREQYGDKLFGVNGHSMREEVSDNINFALLVRVRLTEPLENTTEYGRRIAQLANTLGGKKPLLQRLGDLRDNRRSTWKRIERSHVVPTLRDVTPGDIAMAYPKRIITDLLEGLEMLDRVMPGINTDSTLVYAPEIKFYAMRIKTDDDLRTSIPDLYVAGDGAGVSRGIIGAAATGMVAAGGILHRFKKKA
ncbi:MAG: NAD(P)/FAD-dependent oxidoreductase [Candidatus Bathyarchaeia archaeon]